MQASDCSVGQVRRRRRTVTAAPSVISQTGLRKANPMGCAGIGGHSSDGFGIMLFGGMNALDDEISRRSFVLSLLWHGVHANAQPCACYPRRHANLLA